MARQLSLTLAQQIDQKIEGIRGLGQFPDYGFIMPKINQNSDSGKKPEYLCE